MSRCSSWLQLKESAGTLLYRQGQQGLVVLLVHPSGNYNRRAPWSIPKGEPAAGETLEQAARRETAEETGVCAGELVELGHADYKRSRKRIYCFAGPVSAGIEPHCASWEVDRAEFVGLPKAKELIHEDQKVFLDRLEAHLQTLR